MPRHTKELLDKTRLEKSNSRFTLKGMLEDEFYNLVHLERRKFFYTAWDLTVRPAESIKMVLTGYRKFLYPYFNYLILIGTITIFLSVRYKFFVSGYELGDQSTFLDTVLNGMGFDKQFRLDFFVYAEEFATIVNIVAIPVFSIMSFLLFAKTKHDLAEHFILNVYIGAQQLLFLWLTIPFLEIFSHHKDIIIGIYTVITIIYNIWVYTVFFEDKRWVNMIRSTVAITLAFILQLPINYCVFALLRPILKWVDAIF